MSDKQPRIQVFQLLKDAFVSTIPLYIPLLTFFIPSFIVSLLILGMSPGASMLISIVNLFCITPFVTGSAIFYAHQNLTHRGATLPESLQASGERFTQLVFLTFISTVLILAATLLLILPGIYLSIRLSFIYYALMIERRSAFDSLSRSWQLTEKQWWRLFWAFLALGLALLPVLAIVIAFAVFDPVGIDLVTAFIGCLISPFLSVYYVLLFIGFVNLSD